MSELMKAEQCSPNFRGAWPPGRDVADLRGVDVEVALGASSRKDPVPALQASFIA
jgi:hypothetical protein